MAARCSQRTGESHERESVARTAARDADEAGWGVDITAVLDGMILH